MPSDLPIIRVRTQQNIIDKLKIICDNNNRSMSKEVEFLIKLHIKEYEAEHGEIIIKEEQETN